MTRYGLVIVSLVSASTKSDASQRVALSVGATHPEGLRPCAELFSNLVRMYPGLIRLPLDDAPDHRWKEYIDGIANAPDDEQSPARPLDTRYVWRVCRALGDAGWEPLGMVLQGNATRYAFRKQLAEPDA